MSVHVKTIKNLKTLGISLWTVAESNVADSEQ